MNNNLDGLIQKIKDYPISEVMRRYVSVVRVGTVNKTVCPFHDDHDPSLVINDDRSMWMCFVCNLGGDVIKFVQTYKNLSFKQALEDIADNLGIDFSQYNSRPRVISAKEEMAKRVLNLATTMYYKIGDKDDEFLKFSKSRNLTNETIEKFQLGISLKNNSLSNYLLQLKEETKDSKVEKEAAVQLAIELGLIIKSKYDNNPYYDKFRSRIMFPLWDQLGQVVGFTSRSIHKDQNPKYLNSTDSFFFKKTKVLYGFHLAKKSIRDKKSVIIVEGNMDQIMLTQAGFTNSVAIMGTAFQKQNTNILLTFAKKIYLCFDNDQGGMKIGPTANKYFLEEGVIPNYIDLYPYKDPDEFINKESSILFQQRIDDAIPYIDMLINKEIPQVIPEILEHKLEILESIFEILYPLKNSISAKERIIISAKKLGLKSEPTIINDRYQLFLENIKKSNNKKIERKKVFSNKVPDEEILEFIPEPKDTTSNSGEIPLISLSKVEKILIQNFIQFPDLWRHEKSEEFIDFVENKEIKGYFRQLKNIFFEVDETEYLIVLKGIQDKLPFDNDANSIINNAMWNYRNNSLAEPIINQIILDLMDKVKVVKLKEERLHLLIKQKSLSTEDDQNKALESLAALDKKIVNFEKNKVIRS